MPLENVYKRKGRGAPERVEREEPVRNLRGKVRERIFRNRSPAQVECMRQVLGPGALGRPRGIG